jgi:hypothetical protein
LYLNSKAFYQPFGEPLIKGKFTLTCPKGHLTLLISLG